ncbi:MAG: hypothetical protein EOO28_13045 [Comamonadaceae bacterium]|nr:MAG: hypothetical protein EOO28_13045 [Comamonadaceae bacterium]
MPGSSSIGNAGTTDDNEAHSKADGLGSRTLGEKTVGKPSPGDVPATGNAKSKPDREGGSQFDETNVE